MDWSSIIFGAFLAIAGVFGLMALALYPVMKRRFLLWLAARTSMLALIAVALMPPSLGVVPFTEQRYVVGGMATALSLAFAGPFLANYIEREVSMPAARRWLRRVFPLGALAAGMVPLITIFPPADYVHDFAMLGLLGIVITGLARAIRGGSRAARFQAVAWSGGILVSIYLLLHELVLGVEVANWALPLLAALVLEFVVTSMGIADGFMTIQNQRDIALAEIEEASVALATDPLTGIANRRGLLDQFENSDRGRPDGIALIDCDDFKSINDRYGHDVGDDVLVAIGRGLPDEHTFAARLGGEEFVALLYGENWQSLAESARLRVTEAVVVDVPALRSTVTASAGIAQVQPGESLAAAMKRADRALYAAKEAGRNRSLAITEFVPRPPGVRKVA